MRQNRAAKQNSAPVMADAKIDQPFNINNYHEDRVWLNSMTTAGFALAVNKTPFGVEYFDTTYPDEWQVLFKQKHFVWVDPIVLNAMWYGNSNKRWSEIKAPDVRGVWKTAKFYGLVFGATFARTRAINKSVLSLARNDREFTEQEMDQL